MFETAVQEETFHKLKEYLSELFDEPYYDPENNHFYVRYGTTVLEISVDPYGEEESVVGIMSYCVQDVELEEELLVGLLELNHQLTCGHFSLVGTDIFFAHTLFGKSLDARDLLRAITAVATVADDYDDRIVQRYGGQTALERIQDTGGRRRRQEVGTE
ncbi:MAG TPA: YbjN domain-containing protein [Thermoanaerobaculia bacterium]|nr:YbjN domain-containing protein [Thermoanaerobaculia bacterium]HSN85358.1 YbjN domain-containing protein [Thermoanaerobaculia bacterium]